MNDFDLHGVVGIRLLDATPNDVATVRRQLGPLDTALGREPDITVRFVDRATTKPLTYVGLHDGGFNDDGFFVVQPKPGGVAKALIPFDQIGHRPQLICERAMPAVPHLLSVINLTALDKGVLPLHASAFTAGSTGVLVTGWAKGGKTESLLACMNQGARYVGDEWVYLTTDGQMVGLPEPIRLWAWHLAQLPELLRSRPRAERVRLSTWKALAGLATMAASSRLPGSGFLRKGAPALERQAYLQIPPDELFGVDAVTLRGTADAVVLVESHDSPDIVTEPTTGSEVAARMAFSLADERTRFLAHYRQFRYAFPGAKSSVVEAAEPLESALLVKLLGELPSAKVMHPSPCDIAALGQAVHAAALEAVRASSRQDPPVRASHMAL